ARAQISVHPVAGVHQNRPAREPGLARPTDLCQRDLGLGFETDLVRNSYLAPTFAIARPLLRQIQPIGHRQARHVIGDRQRHRDLTIVLLVKLAAILSSHPDRMLRGQPGSREILLLGSVLFFGLLLITEGPQYVLFPVHVDGAAIGLMLWEVIFFARWWTSGTTASLAFSAILLSSVVWAKQLGVPLSPTFLLMALLIRGLRPAIIFTAWSLATLSVWF